jgi:hypothetical protein
MPLTEEERKERVRASNRRYYARNRDSVKARNHSYYMDNREARIEVKRNYRKNNLEMVKESQKKCYQKNKKKYYELTQKWKKANTENQKKYYRERVNRGIKELSDDYIKRLLCEKNSLRFTDIPQSLIVAKRLELQMKRYFKETENG